MDKWLVYCVLFLGIIVSGGLAMLFQKRQVRYLEGFSVFGGSFLLAIIFVHLLPEVYCSDTDFSGFPLIGNKVLSASILLGFLLQLLLEFISNGHEGHHHGWMSEGCGCVAVKSKKPTLFLLLGLSIHAFFEGIPLFRHDHVEYAILSGILIHNIPLSMILVLSALAAGISKIHIFLLLFIFAIMGPLGSLVGLTFTPIIPYYALLLGLAVGLLLHVATDILFVSSKGGIHNKIYLILVLLAFVLAWMLPSHVH